MIIIRNLNINKDWRYVQAHMSMHMVDDTCGIVAVDAITDERYAVLVFDTFTPNSVRCAWAVPRPIALKYDFLGVGFRAMFLGAGKEYMHGIVSAENEKSLRLSKRMGFVEKTRLKGHFGNGIDGIFMELHRDNCQFINQQLEKVA